MALINPTKSRLVWNGYGFVLLDPRLASSIFSGQLFYISH